MENKDIELLRAKLGQDGYVVFDVNKEVTDLQEVAKRFGRVIPGDKGDVVQTLLAQDKGNGSYGAFTFKVGFGKFPWHTDTAYWDIPVRYLLLSSDKSSPCATITRSFESLKSVIEDFDYLAERAIFMLNIPGRRKLLSCVIKGANLKGYRFDYNIYVPMNHEAVLLSDLILKELDNEHDRIVWTGKNVLIVDNWKFIHSREDASEDKNRSLKRVYLNELV